MSRTVARSRLGLISARGATRKARPETSTACSSWLLLIRWFPLSSADRFEPAALAHLDSSRARSTMILIPHGEPTCFRRSKDEAGPAVGSRSPAGPPTELTEETLSAAVRHSAGHQQP